MSMELPETLIHRVQSFLTGKEAARTTLLSKPWLAAWSTRPTIDLDESHFPDHKDENYPSRYNYNELTESVHIDQLTDSANKAFRRYEESNLTIDTFILCLKNKFYAHYGLAKQWTLKALKLGATDLTFRIPNRNIEIPLDQVFENENVQRLCLQGVNIYILQVIKCTRLKSLTLSDVTLSTDQFLNVISCFPLLEFLSLSGIHCYDEQQVGRSFVLGKLMSLVLFLFDSQVLMNKLFLDDLSSKFPNLKHLTLGFIFPSETYYDRSHEVIVSIGNISSTTLETLNIRYVDKGSCLNFENTSMREGVAGIKLDVPSIRKFTFEGSCMPNFCFGPTTRDQWDSHVSIMNHGDICNNWFYELSKFLTKLKGSKIHLCLRLNFDKSFDYEAGEMDALNVFEVDNLILDTKSLPSLCCYAFLDALFRSCHPKMITLCSAIDDEVSTRKTRKVYRRRFNGDDDSENPRNNYLFICRVLDRTMQEKSSLLLPTQYMYGLRDLEELDAQQLFDGVWKHQPLSSILDYSTSQPRGFRFQLKWKPSLNQYMRRPDDDDDDDDDDDGVMMKILFDG